MSSFCCLFLYWGVLTHLISPLDKAICNISSSLYPSSKPSKLFLLHFKMIDLNITFRIPDHQLAFTKVQFHLPTSLPAFLLHFSALALRRLNLALVTNFVICLLYQSVSELPRSWQRSLWGFLVTSFHWEAKPLHFPHLEGFRTTFLLIPTLFWCFGKLSGWILTRALWNVSVKLDHPYLLTYSIYWCTYWFLCTNRIYWSLIFLMCKSFYKI